LAGSGPGALGCGHRLAAVSGRRSHGHLAAVPPWSDCGAGAGRRAGQYPDGNRLCLTFPKVGPCSVGGALSLPVSNTRAFPLRAVVASVCHSAKGPPFRAALWHYGKEGERGCSGLLSTLLGLLLQYQPIGDHGDKLAVGGL